MKRLNLVLFLVYIVIIGLIGCEKKADLVLPPKEETQTSNLKIEDENNQNQDEKVNEIEKNIPEEIVQSNNPQVATESTNVKIEDVKNQKQERETAEATADISEERDESGNSKIVNDEINKEDNQTPFEYKKYVGYWQLNHSDIKNNDVIRGFSPPLEIVSISNNIFSGSVSFRMTDGYSPAPSYTIKIQEEIKDNKVNFEFQDQSFGSGYGIITLKDDIIAVEVKLKEISKDAWFSIEGSRAYKKIPKENLNITTIPKDLFSYLRFSKKEMIRELGNGYKTVIIDHIDYKSTAYYYPKQGLTFDFTEGEENYVSRIICDEDIEINGARSNMNFEQIQQYLGIGYKFELNDERIPGKVIRAYELFYRIYDTTIRFDSPYEDGKDSKLIISYS
ncbi:MAG: hypothetical protein K0S61_2821 [Anaerocolumna sp.]|jgi:hypothetical protein|nr:hypothetical protein [Anaerocolumna sp.]